MGMAAGQARLLSITSRMSDNELRAQLINNSKMRLATESSKVSEAYVAALNDTQMMFTNYGPDNTSSYQELTFNSLTAYNPYNNQYALSNASGQLLVSETDAKNYVNANGSLDNFLASYGLSQGTTYFDELAKTQVAEDGTVVGIGYTPEELKAMYFGTNGNPGYLALLTSDSYYKYQKYSETLNSTYQTMMDQAWGDDDTDGIRGIMFGGTDGSHLINGSSFNDFMKDTENNNNSANNYTANYYAPKINQFISYLDSSTGVLINGADNELYTSVKEILTSALEKFNLDKTGTYNESTGVQVNETPEYILNGNQATLKVNGFDMVITKKDNNGTISYTIDSLKDTFNGEDASSNPGLKYSVSGSQLNFSIFETTESGGTESATTDKGYEMSLDLSLLFDENSANDINACKSTYYKSEIEAYLEAQFNLAKKNWVETLKYNINPAAFPGIKQTAEFLESGKIFAAFLFGEDSLAENGGPIKPENYINLLDLDGIYKLMELYPSLQISDDFKNVLDLITLENMMDLYGEPKVTWIDSTDTNGSGDAEKKAQWYTNLFERMGNGTKNNFKVLSNGLASSPEWIKFALENGLVTMEQVDTTNEWNTVMYSNVSDITEKTNDTNVTIAEAEYQKAMNKIETKDKQYDLELKNIDTEHNSLQTEYDSIKSAIDKNIERTFKLYS